MAKTQQGLKIYQSGNVELVVPAKGAKFQLEELQAAVGGMIQLLDIRPRYRMYMDEEGKLKSKELNPVANAIAHSFSQLQATDYIVGDIIIVGIDLTKLLDYIKIISKEPTFSEVAGENPPAAKAEFDKAGAQKRVIKRRAARNPKPTAAEIAADRLDQDEKAKPNAERIEAAIAAFPKTFTLKSFLTRIFRISDVSSYVNDTNEVMLYTEVWDAKEAKWLSFSKATIDALEAELVKIEPPTPVKSEPVVAKAPKAPKAPKPASAPKSYEAKQVTWAEYDEIRKTPLSTKPFMGFDVAFKLIIDGDTEAAVVAPENVLYFRQNYGKRSIYRRVVRNEVHAEVA